MSEESKRVTNQEFAKSNDLFKKECELAEVKPTKRQAGKFRNKRGKAFNR